MERPRPPGRGMYPHGMPPQRIVSPTFRSRCLRKCSCSEGTTFAHFLLGMGIQLAGTIVSNRLCKGEYTDAADIVVAVAQSVGIFWATVPVTIFLYRSKLARNRVQPIAAHPPEHSVAVVSPRARGAGATLTVPEDALRNPIGGYLRPRSPRSQSAADSPDDSEVIVPDVRLVASESHRHSAASAD